jgi:hypothetical protein
MFNREEFINKYVALLKDESNDEEAIHALTAELPQKMPSDYYVGITEELIHTLKTEDAAAFAAEIKRLENTVALMKFMADMADEQREVQEDSSNTEGEATSKPESKANEADTAVVTAEAETPEVISDVSQGEAVGDAPTKEEVEKS